jgi:hypothetical protein
VQQVSQRLACDAPRSVNAFNGLLHYSAEAFDDQLAVVHD